MYRIAHVVFDEDACEIITNGDAHHVQPQACSVLSSLVRHQGEVVSRHTLAAEACLGRRTSEESVTRCISILRRHLDAGGDRDAIETIPKLGYRLRVPVTETALCSEESEGYLNYLTDHAAMPTKTAVNLIMTAGVIFLMLSVMLVASDFFAIQR